MQFDQASNVCLVTIMTQERLASLHRMLIAWDGWVSIGMLVDDDEYASAAAAGLDYLRHDGQPVPAPERVALSLVQDLGYRSPRNRFPYNLLRNAAVARCEAEYVFAADVDFVPFPERPSARLRRWITELDVRPGSPNVLVVAAFEQVGEHPTPAAARSLTKPRLRELSASGDLISFASATYEAGHACDEPALFLSKGRPYQTEYRFGCEPYTVVPRKGIHLYDERFVGYGKDRVSWNYELAARRPSLHVVPDLFLVHFHTLSPNASKYGHFPRDWMAGETCWPAFRDRVQVAYNYTQYGCHQKKVDGLTSERYSTCVVDAERICVAPHCAPPITAFLPPLAGTTPRRITLPGRPFPPPAPPPPPPPAAPLGYPGPSVVLLGCEGCGVPAFWRALRTERHLEGGGSLCVALTDRGEPSWRERAVQFADREAKYALGADWYLRRWPIPEGSLDVGMDGSASYLHSAEAALRLPPLFAPHAKLVLVLSDPVTRAARLWRGDRPFAEAVYAEATALARCFEAAGERGGTAAGASGVESLPSHGAWDRCTAVACGSRACPVGGGVYAPQLSGWLRTAPPTASWLIMPAEALTAPSGARYALFRLGLKLSSPDCGSSDLSSVMWEALGTTINATDTIAAAVRAGGAGTARAHAPVARRSSEAAGAGLGPAQALLRVFFGRYNADLEALLGRADPASEALWRAAAWLPREGDRAAHSAEAVAAAAAAVRSALLRVEVSHPESAVIGSRRWLGPFPAPSAFVLGARDSGAEMLAGALLAGNGTCGGPLRLFDDDARYAAGLGRAITSLWRGRNASACVRVMDTTAYLHSRWAPLRLRAALAEAVRLVVVLREPADRATRHWRALRLAASKRGEAAHRPGRKLGEAGGSGDPRLRYVGSRGSRAHAESSGTSQVVETFPRLSLGGTELAARSERPSPPHANVTLLRRARAEIKDIGRCLEQRIAARTAGGEPADAALGAGPGRVVPPLLASEPSAEDWRFCTTTQCNWLECLVGTGLYAPQLRGWLASFSPEQMLLLEASQLSVEPLRVASLVEAFLAVPPLGAAGMSRAETALGRAAYQGKQVLADLRAFYAPHNRDVRRLFDALAPPGAWQHAPWLQKPAGSA